MTLDEWRIAKGYTVSELALILRRKQPVVFTWTKGVKGRKVTPTFDNIKHIKKVTRGKVGYNDWD